MKIFKIDADFYSMEFEVKANNKREARKKAKKMIPRKIRSHINNLYIEED